MYESNIDELKKDYQIIQDKYNLPCFEELNKDFCIEKLSEIETDYLIREIRKLIADKFVSYLKFVETLLHPVNVPIFILSIVRLIDNKDKAKLSKIYEKLAKSEIEIVELDLVFCETKEAEFINNSYSLWQEIREDLLVFIRKIKNDWNVKPQINEKNYFG
ncbi:hypothetical protein ACFLZF_00605 [Nanoarchaeota archaeon]